jgi:predicted ATPase/Tfp pilus assembly protein PilF
LSNIRKLLGDEDYLLITPQNVQINPETEIWSDTGEIEVIIETTKQHRHRDIAHCLPCVQRQLQIASIYKGEFLSGFSLQDSILFDKWMILRRERMHQAGLKAHALLTDYFEWRGEFEQALHHAKSQIEMEPWLEEAYCQTMRLYYNYGKRSHALAQYQECQRIIDKEFGVEPSKQTRALAKLISNEEPLNDPVKHCPQKPIVDFIGRKEQMRELEEILARGSSRLTTILGPGGVGKSSLAITVAINQHGLYKDGIFYVALAESRDVLFSLSSALGLISAGQGINVFDYLKDKDMLLVLDNFDHLIPSASCISTLLKGAPNLQVLVTSRERLNLHEEHVMILKGLSFPNEKSTDHWHSYDSMALFRQRILQRNPDFDFSDQKVGTIQSICQRVEGLPLAIEMASSVVVENNGELLLEALHEELYSVSTKLQNIPERHRSLQIVFNHSWRTLSLEEQRHLVSLAVFKGGFSEEAALVVTGIKKQSLLNLVNKSLLRQDEPGRFSLHEVNWQMVSEKLSQEDDGWEKHAQYYAQFSASSISPEVIYFLDKEALNLVAAWDWSLHNQKKAILRQLLYNISQLFEFQGPLAEGEQLFTNAIKTVSEWESCSEMVVDLKYSLLRIYLAQMRYPEVLEMVCDLPRSARALFAEGQALSAQGRSDEARPKLENALVLARSSTDQILEMSCLRELGNVANRLSEYDDAIIFYSQCLEIAQALGDYRNISAVQNNWASIEWDLGDLDAAQVRYNEALLIYRKIGNRLGEAKALNNLSNIMADRGDLTQSLEYCRQALAIHKDMGNIRGESAVLNNIGATYFLLSDYDGARSYYQRALALCRLSENNQAIAETLGNLSLLNCIQGHLEEGREKAKDAISLSRAAGDKVNEANSHYFLARIEVDAGNLDEAEIELIRALEFRQTVPHPAKLLEIQVEFANIAFQKGAVAEAKYIVSQITDDMENIPGTNEPQRVMAIIKQIQNA